MHVHADRRLSYESLPASSFEIIPITNRFSGSSTWCVAHRYVKEMRSALCTATNRRVTDHVLTLFSPPPLIHPLPLRRTMRHRATSNFLSLKPSVVLSVLVILTIMFPCGSSCPRSFSSPRGLNQHRVSCKVYQTHQRQRLEIGLSHALALPAKRPRSVLLVSL